MAAQHQGVVPASGLEIVERYARSTQAAVQELLGCSAVRHDDINADNRSVFVIGWNRWQWIPLPDGAQPLVGAARRCHDELCHFARLAFAAGAPDRLSDVDQLSTWLLRHIEQPNGSYPNGAPGKSIDSIVAKVEPRIDAFLSEVARLPNAHGSDERLLVADTSALLDRPDLQDWKLDRGAWTVVIVPQVLSELDERKRDSRTAEAAGKVIRQLDSFDGRGDTFVGVPLAGRLSIREVPTNPDMSRTLPWLRADTPDDIIVAAAIELALSDLRGRVAVLASDRNVRNKARMAGLTTVATRDL
jgi:hypothetical protein